MSIRDKFGVDYLTMVETLLRLTDRLGALDMLRLSQTDKYGNHEVQLTPVGENSIQNG